MPESIYDSVSPVVSSVLSQPNAGLLSFSIIIGLWTFARALSALQVAMNKAYGSYKYRDFLLSRFFSLIAGLVVLLVLYLLASLAFWHRSLILQLQNWLHLSHGMYSSIKSLLLPIIAIGIFIAIGLLYVILPNVKIKKLRYILPGTLFSTLVLVFLTNLFGYYVSEALNNLKNFKVAGSLFIFGLMIWFIFVARVLIFGSILNAVYQKHREGKIEPRRGEILAVIKARKKESEKEANPQD
jgi:membrane protein